MDRIQLGAKVRSYDRTLPWSKDTTKANTIRVHRCVGRGAIEISITTSGQGRMRAQVIFNPARWLRDVRMHPCPVTGLEPILDQVEKMLSKILAAWPTDARDLPGCHGIRGWDLMSLDIARDFAVADTDVFIHGLLFAPRKDVRRRRFHDPDGTNGNHTLYVQAASSAESTRVYDRHAKHPEIPIGTLRWEGRFSRRQLTDKGIWTLGHLTHERAWNLALERWHRTSCSATVVNISRLHRALLSSGLTMPEADVLAGWLLGKQTGVYVPENKREARLRAAHRRTDLALLPLARPWPPTAVRLDFENGTATDVELEAPPMPDPLYVEYAAS